MTVIYIKFIAMTLSVLWWRAEGSIAGVTYMDDFDFEERYRNVHECDPFYWHPLHLPDECADLYERLIRSRVPSFSSNRRKANRYMPNIAPVPPMQAYGVSTYPLAHLGYQYPEYPMYPTVIVEPEPPRELTPYEKMLESVQKDVNNLPSMPSVKEMPNLGPVAVYQQPISQVSVDMIKQIASMYVQASDDKDGKDRARNRKGGSRWKELLNKIHRHERQGWKQINNGDVVSISKS